MPNLACTTMKSRVVHSGHYVTFDCRLWRIQWDTSSGMPPTRFASQYYPLVYISPQYDDYGLPKQLMVYSDNHTDTSAFLGTATESRP